MGRKAKQGLDFFFLDVNFYEDMKVRRIINCCGLESVSVLLYILCTIYKNKGYYCDYGDDLTFLIYDTLHIQEERIKEILEKSVEINFFDKKKFEDYAILTNLEIQENYFNAIQRRKEKVIHSEYLLTDLCQHKSDSSGFMSTEVHRVEESRVEKSREENITHSLSQERETKIGLMWQIIINQKLNFGDMILLNKLSKWTDEQVMDCIRRIKKSDFLMGKTVGKRGTYFNLSFKWFVDNFERVYIGQYDNR